jgi:hypothetical protein
LRLQAVQEGTNHRREVGLPRLTLLRSELLGDPPQVFERAPV